MTRMWFPAIGLSLAGGLMASACDGGSANVEFIHNGNKDAGTDGGGGSGGDGGSGGMTGGGDCPGLCVPTANDQSWTENVLLWIGPVGDEPPCPSHAPDVSKRGYDGLIAPHDCDVCTCEPSTGSCALPTQMTAHSELCNLPGSMDTPFDAPDPWDGACTAANAIQPGQNCDVNPCVTSLTIDALTIATEECTSGEIPVPRALPSPRWETMALACHVLNDSTCSGTEWCAPKANPPEWKNCIWRTDGHNVFECMAPFNERYIFHEGFEDGRMCSPCGCGTPAGSQCTATISIYSDNACSLPVPLTLGVDSLMEKCSEVTAGVELGSKEMTPPIFHPGTCQPTGGDPAGEATPILPVTFCCLTARSL